MDCHDFSILPTIWHKIVPITYGYHNCNPEHSFGPAVREFYLLHYILEGEGIFYKGEKEYTVCSGDMFVIHPNEVTKYTASKTNPWKYVWIGFKSEEIPYFLSECVINQPPLRSAFEKIKNYSMQENAEGKIFSLTFDILWQLSLISQNKSNGKNNYAAYVKNHLDLFYMQKVSIEKIADSLHIDRHHLSAVFRKAYGKSPKEYLTELRLEHGKNFLARGHSVSEAAYMSGFTDMSNFSKCYKKHFGVPPQNDKNDY